MLGTHASTVGDRFSRAENRVANGVQETSGRGCRAWDPQQRSRWYELHGPDRCYGSDGSKYGEDMGSQEADAFDGINMDREPIQRPLNEDIFGSNSQPNMSLQAGTDEGDLDCVYCFRSFCCSSSYPA